MGFNNGFTTLQTSAGGGGSTDLTAVASNVSPNADLTYDIGSTSLRWDDIFVEGIWMPPTGSTPILDGMQGGVLWVSASSFGGDQLHYSGSGFSLVQLTELGGIGSPTTDVYFSEKYYELAITEASTSYVTASFNSGSIAHLVASGTFDFVFADIPSAVGKAKSMTLYVSQSSTTPGVITWDSNIVWPGGTAPTLTNASGSIDAFTFFTSGSARVVGFTSGQNLS